MALLCIINRAIIKHSQLSNIYICKQSAETITGQRVPKCQNARDLPGSYPALDNRRSAAGFCLFLHPLSVCCASVCIQYPRCICQPYGIKNSRCRLSFVFCIDPACLLSVCLSVALPSRCLSCLYSLLFSACIGVLIACIGIYAACILPACFSLSAINGAAASAAAAVI